MSATSGPAPADPVSAPVSAPDAGAIRARGVVALATVGALLVLAAGSPAPSALGAASLAAPPTLLALFDVLALVVLAWPAPDGASGGLIRRAGQSLVPLVVAIPFHVALAAAAGAATGHAAVLLVLAAGVAGARAVAGDRRGYGVLVALGWCGWPLATYALADFAGAQTLHLASASPLVAAVRQATLASAGAAPVAMPLSVVAALSGAVTAALPALILCAVVALAAAASARHRGGVGVAAVLVALSSVAGAEPGRVAFDGLVREGRPVTVVLSGAVRARIPGAPWALPAGARRDEFLLTGGVLSGTTLTVQVDRGGGVVETLGLDVRPAPPTPWLTAIFAGVAGEGEALVRAVDLPTLPESWELFDAFREPPLDLPGPGGRALVVAAARDRSGLPSAVSATAALEPFRAAAETAAAAPSLPADVVRVLLVLAAMTTVTALLVARREGRGAWTLVALLAPPLAGGAWLVLGDRLPGPVRVTVDVLDAPGRRLVIVRAASKRGGEIRVKAPVGAGHFGALRWSHEDRGPDADLGPGTAVLRLAPGHHALLVYELPSDDPGGASDDPPVTGDGPGLQAYDAWLRRRGARAESFGVPSESALPEVEGARAVPGGRFRVAARR